MVEDWQYRKYYRPRILIPASDVLENPYPGKLLLCLTGAEVNLIRNMLAYCHRRSTFVVTYDTNGYYCPDNETMDQIEAVVADLEGKLMADCQDLIDAIDAINSTLTGQGETLTDMLAEMSTMAMALECVCNKMPAPSVDDGTREIINAYLLDGTLQPDDPYPLDPGPGIDSDACAIAQLTWHFAYETLTEIVQPAQKKAVAVLLPSAMAIIASWIGTPLVGVPVGVILAVLWDTIEIWVDGRLDDVTTTWFNLKNEIVCAAYEPLADGQPLQASAEAMYEVINDQEDLSPIDKAVFRQLVAPWAQAKMTTAWDNLTTWAVARVDAGYCAICNPLPDTFTFVWPPCPNGSFLNTGICEGGLYCLNASQGEGQEERTLPEGPGGLDYNRLDIECDWKSRFPGGWTVGAIGASYWTGSTWQQIAWESLTNLQPAGTTNTMSATVIVDTPSDAQVRMRLFSNLGDPSPYPLQVERAYFKWYRV